MTLNGSRDLVAISLRCCTNVVNWSPDITALNQLNGNFVST